MQKVDILIGALGVVALVATGLGVALFDEGSDFEFRTVETSLQDMSDDDVDASGQEFTWQTPANATGAHFDITVVVNGATPLDMGAVSVTAVLEGPDGSTENQRHSFDISEGSSMFPVEAMGWMDHPDPFTGHPEERAERAMMWDGPILLTLYVEYQSAGGGVLFGPTFEVQVSGHAFTYEAFTAVPDPEAAQ